MRTSASLLSTPTRRAPLNAFDVAAVQRQRAVRGEREMQRHGYLAGHTTFVTTDIDHARVREQFTQVGAQDASRVHPGDDSDTL